MVGHNGAPKVLLATFVIDTYPRVAISLGTGSAVATHGERRTPVWQRDIRQN